jgi:mannitol 2-dehydrogenase
MRDVYGSTADSAEFAGAFGAALKALWKNGTRETLTRYIGGRPLS